MIAIPEKSGCLSVRDRIVECLAQCQANNLNALSELTGFSCGVIKKELEYLIKRREVEVLRPLPPSSGRWKEPVAVHFRLIRDTDEDYLWEQGVIARFPVSRLSQDFSCAKQESIEKARADQGAYPWLRRVASFAFAMPGI